MRHDSIQDCSDDLFPFDVKAMEKTGQVRWKVGAGKGRGEKGDGDVMLGGRGESEAGRGGSSGRVTGCGDKEGAGWLGQLLK